MSVPVKTPSGMAYHRCVSLGQWQHAANIRGVSVHQVRLDHDPDYTPPIPLRERELLPEDWRQEVVRRLRRLKMTRREFALRAGRSYTTLQYYVGGTGNDPSDEWLGCLRHDLRRFEIAGGIGCSL